MQAAPLPPNETERIAALHAARLLHTPSEAMFDRLTRLASHVFDMPTALISLVDSDIQWFKSKQGLEIRETPRNFSFCSHAILNDAPFIIEDARNDVRFAGNPLVTGAPHIRFYAGIPIRSAEKMKLGTLCLIDYVPRTLSCEQISLLQEIAKSVEDLIYQRQLALASADLLQAMSADRNISPTELAPIQKLKDLVQFDSLTGLPNRSMLVKRMHDNMERWQAMNLLVTVAYIDFCKIKDLDESYSHETGEQALLRISGKLSSLVRPNDLLAHLGSGKFILLMEDSGTDEGAQALMQATADEFRAPLAVSENEIELPCHIGYSQFPKDSQVVDQLLNFASAALHHAKLENPLSAQAYKHENFIPVSKRVRLESLLRHAVQRNELTLHYQPKVDIKSGMITGLEALVRWNSPELGMVSPGEFIPITEETGLIIPVGEWVLHTACHQLKAWHDQGLPKISVAVNLSSRQFLQNDMMKTVTHALEATGLLPTFLELELTESVSMNNPERSAELMHELKQMGIALSIDDFGTGYSSLAYLKKLPIDKIKIDRSFVIDMTQNEDSLTIVQATIAMARRMGMKIVAEGVETEKQLSFLSLNQCDEIQGYFFSKPLPAEECAQLLASGKKLATDANVQSAISALFGSF